MIAPALPDELAINLRQQVMTIAHTDDLVGVDDVLLHDCSNCQRIALGNGSPDPAH